MKAYPDEVEDSMLLFFESLNEKDWRRYAAIETLKLPHGGQAYISEILDCDVKTIQHV